MNFLQTKINEMKKRKEEGNKGFSLVELIIVIAIMAILVGIVGTQVIPYLNKSKASKDLQIINSFSTAAVSSYSEKADKVASTGTIEIKLYAQILVMLLLWQVKLRKKHIRMLFQQLK